MNRNDAPANLTDPDDHEPLALYYEAISERDRRYLKQMQPDRSAIVTAVILASVILSGLLSCGLAGAFWIFILRLLGST